MNEIVITLCVDWAPEKVLEDVVALLEQYRIKATLFATHDSNFLKSLDSTRYEVGIHPNFNDGGDYNKIIEGLMHIYPKALGVCSHSLFQSSHILQFFLNNGLKYDVNTFIPLREGLFPFTRLNWFVCIPFYWGDDTHFSTQTTFGISELRIHKKGLKIYTFHPIHVFMNTDSMEHYKSFKPFYHQPSILRKYRNTGEGTQTLFVGLLQYLARNKLPTYLCRDIYKEYLEEEHILSKYGEKENEFLV